MLGWSASHLVSQSRVSLATIQRAEREDGPVRMTAANVGSIQRALEDAGVEFIPENGGGAGVRMKSKSVAIR